MSDSATSKVVGVDASHDWFPAGTNVSNDLLRIASPQFCPFTTTGRSATSFLKNFSIKERIVGKSCKWFGTYVQINPRVRSTGAISFLVTTDGSSSSHQKVREKRNHNEPSKLGDFRDKQRYKSVTRIVRLAVGVLQKCHLIAEAAKLELGPRFLPHGK
jgi:hypothetical protein